jgi:hypothetical protein
MAEVTLTAERLVGVYDTNDASEFGSADAYLKFELEHTHAGPASIVEKRDAQFRGLPAAFAHYRTTIGGTIVENEKLIVYSSHSKNIGPIFYVIWLRTPTQYYSKDRQLYLQTRDGFRLLPVPKGECPNE